MHLRHLHLAGLTTYTRTAHIQSHLVSLHLAHKRSPAVSNANSAQSTSPAPTLLTFQTPPTYTTGRRDLNALSPEQIAHLRLDGQAEHHEALRGGQTTYHGPGQLTAYLICHLRTHNLTSRDYVRLLESSIMTTLAYYGITGLRDEVNPGVWTTDGRKIASVGVHLRRYISSHGIGLNIGNEVLPWFERIVMCGLPGKKATSFESQGIRGKSVHDVAEVFAGMAAGGLTGVEGVVVVGEEELMDGDVGKR
ncbi:MAG: hypothetical protein LQ350_006254 [Teloschistes chrysophthalmus]|nr:MAG: hypothetical protein LQ350_006254 [Niorma chrysophthalma]